MELEARDQHDQRDHRTERVEQQLGVRAHAEAVRVTKAATMACGASLISHTHACSSGDGSSRMESWLSSSDGGMKCPRRLAMRSARSGRLPARYTKRTSVSPAERSRSR